MTGEVAYTAANAKCSANLKVKGETSSKITSSTVSPSKAVQTCLFASIWNVVQSSEHQSLILTKNLKSVKKWCKLEKLSFCYKIS